MKTFKKVWSFALAGVMALTLCLLSTNLPARAGDGTDYDDQADAVVTKTLQIADGITVPTKTFTFVFANEGFNGDTSQSTKDSMPSITATPSLTFGGETPTDGAVTKESSDVLDGINWTAPGLYTYTVTETSGGTSETINNGTLTYSQAQYTLYVVVAYDSNNKLYVEKTEVKKIVADDGGAGNSTKGDPGSTTNGTGSDLAFVNVYTKQGSIEDGAKALTIKKSVTGTYGDTNKSFSFSLALTLPSTASATSYTGIINDASGTQKSTVTVNASSPTITFSLAHNETLVFEDLPAGTYYILSETGNTNYTPSYIVVQNGVTVNSPTAIKGDGLSTPTTSGNLMLIGEKTNTATFTNEFDDSSIDTGILMNNLPYILLIAAAMLGLVAFAAIRRRREMR